MESMPANPSYQPHPLGATDKSKQSITAQTPSPLVGTGRYVPAQTPLPVNNFAKPMGPVADPLYYGPTLDYAGSGIPDAEPQCARGGAGGERFADVPTCVQY